MILCDTAVFKKMPKLSNKKEYYNVVGKKEMYDIKDLSTGPTGDESDVHKQSIALEQPPTQSFVDLREPLIEQ